MVGSTSHKHGWLAHRDWHHPIIVGQTSCVLCWLPRHFSAKYPKRTASTPKRRAAGIARRNESHLTAWQRILVVVIPNFLLGFLITQCTYIYIYIYIIDTQLYDVYNCMYVCIYIYTQCVQQWHTHIYIQLHVYIIQVELSMCINNSLGGWRLPEAILVAGSKPIITSCELGRMILDLRIRAPLGANHRSNLMIFHMEPQRIDIFIHIYLQQETFRSHANHIN